MAAWREARPDVPAPWQSQWPDREADGRAGDADSPRLGAPTGACSGDPIGPARRAPGRGFRWTTHSSQLYESRLLRVGSPLFHYGILFVLVGHLMGLFVPESWTDAVGFDEHLYHLFSLFGGTFAGVLTILGIALLIYRRRTTG